MPLRLALPPGRFRNTGAGLEPKKQFGEPFRRDPVTRPDLGGAHPKGRSVIRKCNKEIREDRTVGSSGQRAITLNLTTDRVYIPLVTAFMENASQALGLARKEALAITLAAEELFTYLGQRLGPEQDLEIRCVAGGYYVRTDFTFAARELNLRAFNLTSSVSLEDENSLEEMGLLIASRSVDYFHVTREHQRLVLSLTKEKSYPRYERKGIPAPPPINDYRLIPPGPGEVKWLAQLIGEYFSTLEVPAALLYPGKLADIVESREFQAVLAVGPAGEVGRRNALALGGGENRGIFWPLHFSPRFQSGTGPSPDRFLPHRAGPDPGGGPDQSLADG